MMRDQQSCRTTVFGRKIFVFIFERDPRLLVPQILERQICCVTAIRMREGIGSIRFYVCKQGIQRNAFPGSAEFGPPCDAMNINRECLTRQVAKRLPIPSPQYVSAVVYCEFPLV